MREQTMSGAGAVRASRRLLGAGVVSALAALTLASPAWGYHIPGATYNGTVAGGGAVTLTVSADGTGITEFRAEDVPGNTCTSSFSNSYSPPLPITNHRFNHLPSPTLNLDITGRFSKVQRVSGLLFFQTVSGPPCDSANPSDPTDGDVPWSATTTASPAGSEECQEAKKKLKKAKQKAKKTGTAKAEKKVKKAKKRKRKVC